MLDITETGYVTAGLLRSRRKASKHESLHMGDYTLDIEILLRSYGRYVAAVLVKSCRKASKHESLHMGDYTLKYCYAVMEGM